MEDMCYERPRAEACVDDDRPFIVLAETKPLVCPSRTSERGGEGYCVKEGGGEEGEPERERERASLRKVLRLTRTRNADDLAATPRVRLYVIRIPIWAEGKKNQSLRWHPVLRGWPWHIYKS